MASSSSGRAERCRQPGAAAIGVLPIPDPRAWPAEIRAWFQNATGECGTFDVFVFDYGQFGAMYLQDAVTALGILEVDAAEWRTDSGYPIFVFERGRVAEIQQRLGLCGYSVHVLEPADRQKPATRARVIDIACGRRGTQGAQPQ